MSTLLKKKSKRGRPRKIGGGDVARGVRLPLDVIKAVDQFRHEHDLTFSLAIATLVRARLIDLGLLKAKKG
jgi:hypothetical protein